MQCAFSRPPEGTAVGGIDADGGLDERRTIDRQEHPFAEGVARIAPGVEAGDNLPRYRRLEGEEGIVRRNGLARVADLLRPVAHLRHPWIAVAKHLVLQPQRMHL